MYQQTVSYLSVNDILLSLVFRRIWFLKQQKENNSSYTKAHRHRNIGGARFRILGGPRGAKFPAAT